MMYVWTTSTGFAPTNGLIMFQISDTFDHRMHTITKYLPEIELTSAVDPRTVVKDFIDRTILEYNEAVPEKHQVELVPSDDPGVWWTLQYKDENMKKLNQWAGPHS